MACEAKLLAKSGQEEAFEVYATNLSQRITKEVLAGVSIHPSVTVVLKDVHSLPPVNDVVRVVADGRARYLEGRLEYRSPTFNVFIEAAEAMSSGVTESRSCFLLCPKSEKEDLRVQRPGAKASRQLSSPATADHPGMLLLGVTSLQDAGYVVSLFRRRFAGGQYPGISGVMLIHAGTHVEQPLRSPLDLIVTVRKATLGQLVESIAAASATEPSLAALSAAVAKVNDLWVNVKHRDDPSAEDLLEGLRAIRRVFEVLEQRTA